MAEISWVRDVGSPAVVVFVHGILSGSENAWCTPDGICWPQLLPTDISGVSVDVVCIEYRSDLLNPTYSISDVIASLDGVLRHDRILERKIIIFVCHSMGGLIVRRWIVDEQTTLLSLEIRLGLLLVASPSAGSHYANLLHPLSALVGNVQNRILRTIQQNDWIESLDQSFFNLKEGGKLSIRGQELIEDKPPPLLRWLNLPLLRRLFGPIVSQESAARYFGRAVKIAHSDHQTIAKPTSENSRQHKYLLELMHSVIKDAQAAGELIPTSGTSNAEPRLFPLPMIHCVVQDGSDLDDRIDSFLRDCPETILWISGPSEAGKTLAIRRMIDRSSDLSFEYLDLTSPDSLELLRSIKAQPFTSTVAVLDHLEALSNNTEVLSPKALSEIVAAVATRHLRVIVVAASWWESTIVQEFGLLPRLELLARVGGNAVKVETVRPFTEAELQALCLQHNIPPALFPDEITRTVGVIALALALKHEGMLTLDRSGHHSVLELQLLVVKRYLTSSPTNRELRAQIWRYMGLYSMGNLGVDVQTIRQWLGTDWRDTDILNSIRDPLYARDGRLFYSTIGFATVGAAMAISDLALGRQEMKRLPISPTGAAMLCSKEMLMQEAAAITHIASSLDRLRESRFDAVGYSALAVATLALSVDASIRWNFSKLWLQGPPHREAVSVPNDIRQNVAAVVTKFLSDQISTVISRVRQLPNTLVSCYEGDDRLWATAREWARHLPLKTIADEALWPALGELPAWRYENILDDVFTHTTTEVMRRNSAELSRLLSNFESVNIGMLLADLWDGINDGCWDAFIHPRDQLTNLKIASGKLSLMNFSGAQLERAVFGNSDVQGTVFTGANLHLADFRSTQNVQTAVLEGANWWAAMLRPSDRYALSRLNSTNPTYLEWCRQPPWNNPYYSAPWPKPFGDC
jgi:hypothetical protein